VRALKVDFHCHILPDVDHGSSSVEQSLRMLRAAKESGIRTIVAAHHFYGQKSTVSDFLDKRNQAYDLLHKAMMPEEQLPRIVKGAEVYMTTELAHLKDLDRLCIENTDYILIEMPYEYWSKWVYESIFHIIVERKLIPVIAHVERFFTPMRKDSEIAALLEMDVYAQMNTDSIADWQRRHKALELIDRRGIHILGTDAHDELHIARDVQKAERIIGKFYGTELLDYYDANAAAILANRQPRVYRYGDDD